MSEEQDLKFTDFDHLTSDHRLQMMKAALPYLNAAEQKMISMFVKFNELKRTMSLFEDEEVATMGICSVGSQKATPLDMMNAIKPYGSTYEQDFIDLVVNFFQGFRLYHDYQKTASDLEAQGINQDGSEGRSGKWNGSPLGNLPIEQLKNFMPPEQQSKLETIQLMMSVMQQMT